MRFGLYLPNFGAFGDARTQATLAREAEAAGWNGFFLWDHVARDFSTPVVDPWIALTAVAMATESLRLGALVTPVPRRRPWKLARETVTLDHLSGGRLVFGAGLGSGRDSEWSGLGEASTVRERAERLDEGLDLLAQFWSGEPVCLRGKHFRVDSDPFRPRPLQRPRIPVWIAANWPHRRPLARAARWDGVFPLFHAEPGDELAKLADVATEVRRLRAPDEPFDLVHLAATRNPKAALALARDCDEVGVTWLLERITPDAFGASWEGDWPLERMRERVRAGPPERLGRRESATSTARRTVP